MLLASLAAIVVAPSTISAAQPAAYAALAFETGLGEERFTRAPLDAERYIVIPLVENRLYLMEGTRVIWSAPVATGGGFTLEAAGRSWQFDTPRGVFRIQREEIDPVWVKPEWAYLREGLPVPPLHAPERRQRGMLGNTALFIGYELALHGTDRPDLVLNPDPEERRVSHGCIRLTDEDARILYHMVDPGTLVLIY
ncbi:MAG TPA: L,D-transpeptidase [Longimicrobiales bacterium]|nr:L,D-transpeptidase [Longimicrobiales bacterium]